MKWTVFAVAIWLSIANDSSAQGVMPTDHGTQAFRAVLHRLGLQPVTRIETLFEKPKTSLLIVVGDTEVMTEYLLHEGLRNFIKRGGAALFASDQPTQRLLINELEIIINGVQVYCPHANPNKIYRGEFVECPLLQRPIRHEYRSDDVDLLQGLNRVATNRPSFLQRLDPAQQTLQTKRVVAETPEHSRFARPARIGDPPITLHLAVADELGKGRYCVIADHSIFINSMMLQPDNDNIAFTTNVINWLTENGKRNQVLFVDDGQVRSEFDFNLDFLDPPLPHPDVIAPAIDKLIMSLEQDNFFNRTIQRLIPLNRLLRYLLLGLTVGVAALILYRITAGKHRREVLAARLPDHVESLADTTPFDERIAANTDQAVLANVGRELAHKTFRDLLGQELTTPPQVSADGIWAGRKWSRRVGQLWQLASGETSRTMSAAELKQWARQLDELRQAVDRGTVRLLRPEDLA